MNDFADSGSYCRQIEIHLCQKNGGHLVRVVGPSFDLVMRWYADGIPLNVARAGIDRYFERYDRKNTRRRPVRIDFCDADVRDMFDEWRRATGAVRDGATAADAPPAVSAGGERARGGPSLPEHLTRAVVRLTNARATGRVGAALDPIVDAVSSALDAAKVPGGVRGDARAALLERLAGCDAQLAVIAREAADAGVLAEARQQAEDELGLFRRQMDPSRFAQAIDAAVDRIIRARLGLPILTFS